MLNYECSLPGLIIDRKAVKTDALLTSRVIQTSNDATLRVVHHQQNYTKCSFSNSLSGLSSHTHQTIFTRSHAHDKQSHTFYLATSGTSFCWLTVPETVCNETIWLNSQTSRNVPSYPGCMTVAVGIVLRLCSKYWVRTNQLRVNEYGCTLLHGPE